MAGDHLRGQRRPTKSPTEHGMPAETPHADGEGLSGDRRWRRHGFMPPPKERLPVIRDQVCPEENLVRIAASDLIGCVPGRAVLPFAFPTMLTARWPGIPGQPSWEQMAPRPGHWLFRFTHFRAMSRAGFAVAGASRPVRADILPLSAVTTGNRRPKPDNPDPAAPFGRLAAKSGRRCLSGMPRHPDRRGDDRPFTRHRGLGGARALPHAAIFLFSGA